MLLCIFFNRTSRHVSAIESQKPQCLGTIKKFKLLHIFTHSMTLSTHQYGKGTQVR